MSSARPPRGGEAGPTSSGRPVWPVPGRARGVHDRGMKARTALGIAAALATACATASKTPERPDALARPEPDPACRGTVQGLLAVNGLEQVTVKVAVTREGRPSLVQVLTPDLTPAAALEVRRALESCAWKPAVGPEGNPVEGNLTLAIRRR